MRTTLAISCMLLGLGCSTEEAQTCSTLLKTSGALRDTKRDLDVEFQAEPATATVRHKIDIDKQEDRCISYVQVTTKVMDSGCTFRFELQEAPGGGALQLSALSLSVDSFCLGWPDDTEGTYTWNGRADGSFAFVSSVPDRTAEISCFDSSLRLDGSLTMCRGGEPFEFMLDNLKVVGTFTSAGNTESSCPATIAAAGKLGDPSAAATCQ